MRRVLWLCLGVLCFSAFLALAGCEKTPTSPTYPSENPGPGCRYILNSNNRWTLSCGTD